MSKWGAWFLIVCGAVASSQQAKKSAPIVNLRYEEPIHNGRYPELLYWFVTPETLKSERYTRDVEHIARDTVFDFPILTAREGVVFTGDKPAHDAVAGIVRDAHENGLRIGVSLGLGDGSAAKGSVPDEEQTVVADGEGTLDAQGAGSVEASIKLRSLVPQKTELLRAWAFRKTGPGEYDAATLSDVTAQAISKSPQPGTLSVAVNLGPQFAGYTLFVLAENWYGAVDLFNPAFAHWIHNVIDEYRDVPLDGTALDEFGYIRIPMVPTTPWRGHFAGHAFAARFEQTTGMPLARTLFESRYAPAGHPEVRIRAIDEYWDFFRKGPLGVENEFFRYSRQVFGEKNFAGIHNTFHNHLTNDEAWATGINWWTIPRQYGMSDEDLSLPLRMGLLVAHPGNIMYDQFYGWDIHRFAAKAMNDARFDARIHYHGYNDTGRWGVDLSTEPFLSKLNPVERKIRLLNRFDPAAPELPLLVIFGMPALLNWYSDESVRNQFDLNGSLHIEEKVKAIWDAGYRCAVVPSDLIDNGSLYLDKQNRPTLNGHLFRAVVFLYPQYAKRTTLAFLGRYTQGGGRLMLEGDATRDFDGAPIGDLLRKIVAKTTVTGFSVDKIPQLGVEPSPLRGFGGELEDGSVILTDLDSLESHQPKQFSIDLDGHHFSGSYEGVFALKAAKDGAIEKLACGACSLLNRDGKPALRLANAADLILTRSATGTYEAVIEGSEGSNEVQLYK
jgi:hypothetical protein